MIAPTAALVSISNILAPYPRLWALPFAAAATAATIVPRLRALAPLAAAAFLVLVSLNYLVAIYPNARPWYVAPVRAEVIPATLAAGSDAPGAPLNVYVNGGDIMVDTPAWPDVLFYSRRPLREIRQPALGDTLLTQSDAARLHATPLAQSGPYVYAHVQSLD